ncbi:hypothetical protein FRC19_009183 [Serendipita sp. 401]|nr:hypothetical protein FRC19_009183 [Serendipita sp. 401]KAG9053509.1 hypothetical protein FS842_008070 [Serendipita sp. 407]
MHFTKALILPIVLALTVAAAPIPAPEGNLVTLVARKCNPHTDPGCHRHRKLLKQAVEGEVQNYLGSGTPASTNTDTPVTDTSAQTQ